MIVREQLGHQTIVTNVSMDGIREERLVAKAGMPIYSYEKGDSWFKSQ